VVTNTPYFGWFEHQIHQFFVQISTGGIVFSFGGLNIRFTINIATLINNGGTLFFFLTYLVVLL